VRLYGTNTAKVEVVVGIVVIARVFNTSREDDVVVVVVVVVVVPHPHSCSSFSRHL
jgi:hypothetical protein